jgi:oligopeptide transport system substrate-binding protein
MSKVQKCMQQVHEITEFELRTGSQFLASARILRRCRIIAAILLISSACSPRSGDRDAPQEHSGQPNKSNPSRILRRGIPGEPLTLDPQLADDNYSFQVVRDLYEGLTAEDPSGHIVPGVAMSWSIDKSGTIYTFLLRPNAKWSDGTTVVASEFVQGLRRAVDPRTASGSAALLAVIKNASDIFAKQKAIGELGVSAIGYDTVRIELQHPAPFILQVLSQPIAAPIKLGEKPDLPIPQVNVAKKPTNGAYVFVRRVLGSYIELSRNPYYWDATHVSIDRVRYVNAESEATELREYRAGQLDMTFSIPLPDLSRLQANSPDEVQMSPILGTLYLALNVSALPLKNNSDLRQALSMAVERNFIADHVMMGVTPAYAYVAQGTNGYTSPAYAWAKWPRQQQLSYARYLFARAGYSDKKPLTLRLYFNSGESIQRIMLAVAGAWKQNLGVSTELISDEFRVFLEGRKDRSRWDVARLGWSADYDDPESFLDVFAQENNQNDPAYRSEEFDGLIRSARNEPDAKIRLALLRKSEQVLLNDYPIIPIYFYVARRLIKPYLGGAQITPLNRTYSRHLYWKSPS